MLFRSHRRPAPGGDMHRHHRPLAEANQRKGNWWGWSDLKRALEYMFLVGDVVSGGRDAFKRLYALPEQILPAHVLNHVPDHGEARRQLLEQAALAGGVSTLTVNENGVLTTSGNIIELTLYGQ